MPERRRLLLGGIRILKEKNCSEESGWRTGGRRNSSC